MMKVAHLIDSGGLYGAEHMLLSLCKEQQKSGLEVVVISIGTPSDNEKPVERALTQAAVNVIPWRMQPLPSLSQARKIIQFCMANQVKVIHSHGYKGNILLGLLPGFMRKLPVVTTMHGYTKSRAFGKLAVYQWLDRQCIQRLNAVVLVSPAMIHQIPAAQLGTKLRIIANGVAEQVENFAGYQSLFRDSAYRIGAIGRLSHEKNFEFLIRSMPKILAQIPQAQLVIYGEGPQRPLLEAVIQELNLAEHVLLPGYTNTPDAFLNDLDVFVNCSLTEGMPISIIEAMRAQCHIVASRIPANEFLLQDINFLNQLFELNESSLCESLRTIYTATESLKQQQKRFYKDHFLNLYTLEKMSSKYQDLYRELIAND